MPQFVLLNVDLCQVLHGINSSDWPLPLRKRELLNESRDEKGSGQHRAKTKLTKLAIGRLQLPSENDQMMRAYLQHPFFKRFKCILVNKVRCEYSENAQQLSASKAKMSVNGLTPHAQLRYKYFQSPDVMGQVIHQKLYAAWERNLSLLEPAALFARQVSESGGSFAQRFAACCGVEQAFSANLVLKPPAIDAAVAYRNPP